MSTNKGAQINFSIIRPFLVPDSCRETERNGNSVSADVTDADFPKLAEKLSVIRTDRHENLVRPKNILPVRKKSPQKFTVTCIMFGLAFLE